MVSSGGGRPQGGGNRLAYHGERRELAGYPVSSVARFPGTCHVSLIADELLYGDDTCRMAVRYILSVTKSPVFSIRGVSGGDTDGPSSGAIFATSYMLTLLDEAFPEDVAMTGAIDNRMNIIAVGGLADKLDAAYYMDNGDHQMPIISLVYIPAENKEDFEGWQVSMGLTVTWNDVMQEAWDDRHIRPEPLPRVT